jgi:hypothetical protein
MMFQPVNNFTSLCRPTTVDQVVDLLYDDISLRDKVIMADLSEYQLDTSVYLAMAKVLRKEFGLYNGNMALLDSCHAYMGKDYDRFEDPAMVIIKELWKRVREKHTLHLVEKQYS